jgi:hypothetical protein
VVVVQVLRVRIMAEERVDALEGSAGCDRVNAGCEGIPVGVGGEGEVGGAAIDGDDPEVLLC